MYKVSKFNIFLEKNNCFYVSSSLSHSLIELTKSQFSNIKEGCLSVFSEDELQSLNSENIIVDSEIDEIGLLRYAYNKAKYSDDYMDFVIAPTLECNFACQYCFETRKQGRMSEDVQNKVVDFFESKLKNNTFKKVKLAWYGGEPLICFDIVEKLTNRINEISSKYNTNLQTVMTTNGYLLNEQIVASLEKMGFDFVQIIIDGPKEIHDKRRKLISGEGTFDRIINNIKLFNNSKVQISVRINIDKENSKSYKPLTAELDKLNMDNIRYYPALVEFTPNQESCREKQCMTAAEFGEFANTEAKEYYFLQNGASIQNITYNCGAEHIHSYAIDNLGYVYKCWNSVGYEKDALFSLDNPNDINPVIASRYLARDPFYEKECDTCAYLPICGGGCCYDYLHNKTHSCIPKKYLYNQLIFDEFK